MIDNKQLNEFRQQVSSWITDNVPKDPGFLLPQTFMEVGSEQQLDFLREWQFKVWQAGYLGMAWPKEYGGLGVEPIYQIIADSEMTRHRTPIIFNTIGTGWAGPLILDIGTTEAKERYLKRILNAEDIWCQGFSEPNHGSDLGSVQTKAVRDGDSYIINGSKIWTTLGNFADYMILLARTNPDAKSRYAGLSFFLAPMKIGGVTTNPIQKLTGEYGFTETFFNNAQISADCIMGAEGQGWKVAMKTLQYERGAEAGSAGGINITHTTTDDIFKMGSSIQRDGKPVLDDPCIRDELIQLRIEEQAQKLSKARQNIPELTGDYPFSLALSSKLSYTELARKMRKLAIKLQGAKGSLYVNDETAIDRGFWQRAYMNNFSTTIGGGTSQIQANIIGEHCLGLAKS